MIIKTHQSHISEALKFLSGGIDRKPIQEIFSACKISTIGDKLELIYAGINISLKAYCECEVEEPGSVQCNLLELHSICEKLEDFITISDSGKNNLVTIKTKGAKFNLVKIVGDIEYRESEQGDKIDALPILKAIPFVAFAISQNNLDFNFSGLIIKEDCVIGMRSHLIASYWIDTGFPQPTMLPKKGIALLEDFNACTVSFDSRYWTFRSGNRSVTLQSVAAEPPDVRQRIQLSLKDSNIKAYSNKKDLIKAIRTASIIHKDISISSNMVGLVVKTDSSTVMLPCKADSNIEMMFDSAIFLESLNHFNEEQEIQLCQESLNSPIILNQGRLTMLIAPKIPPR